LPISSIVLAKVSRSSLVRSIEFAPVRISLTGKMTGRLVSLTAQLMIQ